MRGTALSTTTPMAAVCVIALTLTLAGAASAWLDEDEDKIPTSNDNCWDVSNPLQIDTNLDGFGNQCDPDVDNDGVVGAADFSVMGSLFGGPPGPHPGGGLQSTRTGRNA